MRVEELARSDAMTMSPVVTQSSPAPQHKPLTATMIGLVMLRNGGVPSWGASQCGSVVEVLLALVDDPEVVGDVPDVGTSAEGATRRR